MNRVAERDVPVFFEVESNFPKAVGSTSGYAKCKNEVLELVGDAGKACVDDKVRLICTFALSLPNASTADIDEAVSLLKVSATEAGKEAELLAGLKAIEYVKKIRSMSAFSNASSQIGGEWRADCEKIVKFEIERNPSREQGWCIEAFN